MKEAASSSRAQHLVHGFVSPAVTAERGTVQLVRGKGIYVWDRNGRRYIDGMSSLWNVAVGHGEPSIARAVHRQMRHLAYAPTLLGFSSRPAEELARRIVQLAPRGLTRVFFTSGGSEANESVIRLVRLYWRLKGMPEKYRIVALNRAYHGSSTGAASLTGLPYFHHHYEPLLDGVVRMVRPHCFRCELGRSYPECGLACADELEAIVQREGADRIGAFIAEPVQGVGGVIVPPPGYHERIRALCDRYGILLIYDEVITGFGRLGYPFGIQRWKVVPDMISFAKGITSGYLPLGGVLMKEEIYRTFVAAGPEFSLHHGFTYSGHPAVCAAALANLNLMRRRRLLGRARRLEPFFLAQLRRLERHDLVGEVRAVGLMGAVEFATDRITRRPVSPQWQIAARVREECLKRGLIVRASSDVLVLCPPLVAGRKDLAQMVGIIDAAIATVSHDLTGKGAERGVARS